MIPDRNNSRASKKTVFNILDSAANSAPIAVDISPRLKGISNANGAVQNEP